MLKHIRIRKWLATMMLMVMVLSSVNFTFAADGPVNTDLPDMTYATFGAESVSLSDGRVMVLGGESSLTDKLATTSIFDPDTGTWSAGPSLNVARSDFAVVQMDDGRVVVIGGRVAGDEITASTEIWDLGEGGFVAGPDLNMARSFTSAVVLNDGRVMVMGANNREPGESPYITSISTDELTDTTEFLDLDNGEWIYGPSMPYSFGSAGAAVMADGRVLIAGGYGVYNQVLSKRYTFIFDPETNEWTKVADMSEDSCDGNLSLLSDGTFLYYNNYKNFNARIARYIPDLGSIANHLGRWESGGSLPDNQIKNYAMTAMLYDDFTLFYAGGYTSAYGEDDVVHATAQKQVITLPVAADLDVGTGELQPAFDPSTMSYTVSVGNATYFDFGITSVDGSNVEINGYGKTSGSTKSFSLTSAVTELWANVRGESGIKNYYYLEVNRNGYNLTYDGNGAESGSVPSDVVKYLPTETITVLGNSGDYIKSGFKFMGWNTAADGSGTTYSADDTLTISEDTTLYAKWTPSYSLSYDGNGAGSGSAPVSLQEYLSTDQITVLDNAGNYEKDNYQFVGWNTAADGSGTNYVSTDTLYLSANTVFYAQWTPLYTLTYDGNGAESGAVPSAAQSYLATDEITVLDNSGNFERANYRFAGWNTSADGSGTDYAAANTLSINTDTVLYAQWAPLYTLTYDGNSADSGAVPGAAQSYIATDEITVLDNSGNFERTGYRFTGWNTAADGSGTDYASADTLSISTDTVLYAQWAPLYTLTYDGNSADSGDVPSAAQSYISTDRIIALSNSGSFVKADYQFTGWNTAADGTGLNYSIGDTFSISEDTVLYVNWSLETCKVTYYGNGLTSGSAPTDVNEYAVQADATVLNNTNMTKVGYTFIGWNTEADGQGQDYDPGDTLESLTSDVALYAQWKQDEYKVTYDGNGNTSGSVPVDSKDYVYGDTAIVRENSGDLAKTYSTFGGWNTSADGFGTSVSSGSAITINGDTTLYAKWMMNSSQVTYNGNGNTSGSVPVDNNAYTYEDTLIIQGNPGNLKKTGYAFTGWNTLENGSGTQLTSDSSIKITTDLMLYADWGDEDELLEDTLQNLTLSDVFDFASGDTWECVTEDFGMISEADNDVQITWTSDHTETISVDDSGSRVVGEVTRSEDGDIKVIMTAKLSLGDAEPQSKDFLLIVKVDSVDKEPASTRVDTGRDADSTVETSSGEVSASFNILRTELNDGTLIDTTVVTDTSIAAVANSISTLDSDEERTVKIELSQSSGDEADELAIEIEAAAITSLANKNALLNIETDEGSVQIQASTLQSLSSVGSDLYFRIVPVKVDAEQEDFEDLIETDAAIVTAMASKDLSVLGIPRKIETNLSGYSTRVVIPFGDITVPSTNTSDFLDDLQVFVEHDGGSTELLTGTIVYESGVPSAIGIDITQFSQFQIVKLTTMISTSSTTTSSSSSKKSKKEFFKGINGGKLDGITIELGGIENYGSYEYAGIEVAVLEDENSDGKYEIMTGKSKKINTTAHIAEISFGDLDDYKRNKEYKLAYRVFFKNSEDSTDIVYGNANNGADGWENIQIGRMDFWFMKVKE